MFKFSIIKIDNNMKYFWRDEMEKNRNI